MALTPGPFQRGEGEDSPTSPGKVGEGPGGLWEGSWQIRGRGIGLSLLGLTHASPTSLPTPQNQEALTPERPTAPPLLAPPHMDYYDILCLSPQEGICKGSLKVFTLLQRHPQPLHPCSLGWNPLSATDRSFLICKMARSPLQPPSPGRLGPPQPFSLKPPTQGFIWQQ